MKIFKTKKAILFVTAAMTSCAFGAHDPDFEAREARGIRDRRIANWNIQAPVALRFGKNTTDCSADAWHDPYGVPLRLTGVESTHVQLKLGTFRFFMSLTPQTNSPYYRIAEAVHGHLYNLYTTGHTSLAAFCAAMEDVDVNVSYPDGRKLGDMVRDISPHVLGQLQKNIPPHLLPADSLLHRIRAHGKFGKRPLHGIDGRSFDRAEVAVSSRVSPSALYLTKKDGTPKAKVLDAWHEERLAKMTRYVKTVFGGDELADDSMLERQYVAVKAALTKIAQWNATPDLSPEAIDPTYYNIPDDGRDTWVSLWNSMGGLIPIEAQALITDPLSFGILDHKMTLSLRALENFLRAAPLDGNPHYKLAKSVYGWLLNQHSLTENLMQFLEYLREHAIDVPYGDGKNLHHLETALAPAFDETVQAMLKALPSEYKTPLSHIKALAIKKDLTHSLDPLDPRLNTKPHVFFERLVALDPTPTSEGGADIDGERGGFDDLYDY